MKSLILYYTKTGATAQYVAWLCETCGNTDKFMITDVAPSILVSYDRIIFALPTYGGQIAQKEFMEQHWQTIKSKEVFLIVVGMVPQEQSWSMIAYNTVAKEVREGLKGYVKIPGISQNGGKKPMSWFEKLALKYILRTDPEKMRQQSQVVRADLEPVLKMLGV
jgi:menaquinone-dependent protoporphyrinogen IX oxidase